MSQKFFLSTTTNEFARERGRLATLLERTNLAHALHQKKFTQHGTTLLTILEEIRESNIVIQVLGAQIGATPTLLELYDLLDHERMSGFEEAFPNVVHLAREENVTYTQWETWLALHLEKDLWLYQLVDATTPTADPATNSNTSHLKRLKADRGRFPTSAATVEELYDCIFNDLIRRKVLTPEEAEEDKARRRREKRVVKMAMVALGLVAMAGLVLMTILLRSMAPPPSVNITLSRVKFSLPKVVANAATPPSGLDTSPLENAKVLLEQSIFEPSSWDKKENRLTPDHAAIMARLKGFAAEQDVVFSVLCDSTPRGVHMVLPRFVEVTFHGTGFEQAVLVVGRAGGFRDSKFLLLEPSKASVDQRESNTNAPLRFELWPSIGDDRTLTRAESRLGYAVIVLQPSFDPPIETISLKTTPR